MNLPRTSIRRPVAVLMAMMIVVLLGVVSFANLKLDLLPKITPPVAAVITTFGGASANEVADLVTVPLESAAVTTSGIKDIMSISQEGVSIVVLTFDWGQDMAEARSDIAQKIELVPLPDGTSKPTVMKFDPTLLPVMQISVSQSKNTGLGELTALTNNILKPRLEGTEGVASVEVMGGLTQQIEVSLDPAKLSALGLTQESVAGVIAASNLNYPLGELEQNEFLLDLRLEGKFKSVEDLEELVVGYAPAALLSGNAALLQGPAVPGAGTQGVSGSTARSGQGPATAMVPVRLKDIAEIKQDYAKTTSVTRINGEPSVTLLIKKEGSANTVTVARAIRDELETLESELSGLDATISFDQANFIEQTISSVGSNLLLGAALAILVLIVFLRDIRTTIVIAVSIPFSVIATFVLMYFGKLTLNIMTLGGLTLGVGMLVDNSIVVLENIYRHIEDGEEPREASALGAQEVASAITASTLTTVVVFLPVVFVGGVSGIIFKELAWTVTLSLLASLIVSLTVVPMLASKWLAGKKKRGLVPSGGLAGSAPDAGTGGVGQRISRKSAQPGRYERLVEWSLHNRFLVFLIVASLVAGAAYLGSGMGTEFLPSADEGSFSMSVSMPQGSSLEKIDSLVSEIEDILDRNRSIDMYSISIGRGDGLTSMRLSRGSSAEITATVTSDVFQKKQTRQVMEDIEKQVDKIKGDAEVTFNLQSSVAMMAGGMGGSVEVSVSGPDIQEVSRLNDILIQEIQDVEGVKDVTSTLTERKRELHVIVDKDKAILYGLTPAQVGSAVSRAVKGQTVSRLEKDGATYNIVVRYQDDAVRTTSDIESMVLAGRTGNVALKDIAEVIDGEGPMAINRIDQRLSASINAEYSRRSLGVVTNDISNAIADLNVPEGYKITVGGMSQIMTEGFNALKLALILAAILVYMVMAASFESLAMPFVIMFTMPLGAIGVVAALYLSGYAFGITAFIGVIVLAGVIVNNGIVMVDFINQRRAAGLPLGEAICNGSSKRLRPVLMTSLTTILGLVPMALGLGEGAELSAPMALSIMGGLTAGTLLTLVVVPVVYSVFAGYKPERPVSKLSVDREQEMKEYERLQGLFHGHSKGVAPGSGPKPENEPETETGTALETDPRPYSSGDTRDLTQSPDIRHIQPDSGSSPGSLPGSLPGSPADMPWADPASHTTGKTEFHDEDMAQLIELLTRLMASAKRNDGSRPD